MNKKIHVWIFLGLMSIIFNQVICTTCYSCTGCLPKVNGEKTDCQNYDCYVGQLSSGRVNQGCRFTFEEENVDSYISFRTCNTDLCNLNNYDEILEKRNSNRSNEINRESIKFFLFILSFLIRTIFD